METMPLTVSDETLRDGEQQAGLFFPYEDKKKLVSLIAKTGVSYIHIMPFVDEREERLVKEAIAAGLRSQIVSATMMGKAFIDHAKACGVGRITLFHAVSDRLLLLRDPTIRRSPVLQGKTLDEEIPKAAIAKIRQNAIDRILENLRYATSAEVGLQVEFAAEDASRADFDFLVECIREFRPYIEHFMLCDTVGILSPEKAYVWTDNIRQGTNDAPLAVHFHNDLGMALENTLQAILAGASMVSGTFLGIGERAGNVALEQVLNGLRVRFGVEVEGIDYDAVAKVLEYLQEMGARPAAPYSPEALRHKTGIHVSALLRDPKSYSIFSDEEPEIWFGKYSGASNFQYLFEKFLNKSLPKEEYQRMRSWIKSLAIKEQRSFSLAEVLELLERGV